MKKCTLCKIDCDNFIQHVKSEWHIYNLRRETIGLSPVTLEDFKIKQHNLVFNNLSQKSEDYYCCNKVFKSVQTYENHLKSKKHCENVKNNEKVNSEKDDCEEMLIEYLDEIESVEESQYLKPLTSLDCLFCNASVKSIDMNLLHMKEKHNFNLPYPEYICDINGLMEYLTCLIDEYHVCLQCNKQFDDRLSVRNHMFDLNHMKLYFHLETNGDDLCDYYMDLPKPLSLPNLDDMQVEAVLSNGKRIGNRSMNIYFKQNLNGLSNVNNLAITSGVDKAKMSLVNCGRYGQLTKAVMTPQEKKYKTLEARYIQLRSSRYSNFQQHFRAQILM